MVIKRLTVLAWLFLAAHCSMAGKMVNVPVTLDEEKEYVLISNGGHWVFSDPFYRDVVDVLISITGGKPFNASMVKKMRYRFKKMLGPFGCATFTGWGSQEKPPMVGPVRLVDARALVGGVDKESAVRMLEEVKDSLNKSIRYDGFVKRQKGRRGIEIVSTGQVLGGWHIMLSCEETDDESWRFHLKMEYAGFGSCNEKNLTDVRNGQSKSVKNEVIEYIFDEDVHNSCVISNDTLSSYAVQESHAVDHRHVVGDN